MCIFSVAYRVFPDCPIFVLTNRDESTERPTLLPDIRSIEGVGLRWFGGADQRAGGTWFGVNERGLLAAVTNRKTATVPTNPRSRGLLCRDVLGHATAESALDWLQQELSRNPYAGFNLLVLTASSAFVLEHADERRVHQLEPGIHSIGNGRLDAIDDHRVRRMQALVEEMVNTVGTQRWSDGIEPAKAICSLHQENNEPALCLHGAGWGTVGSTIVGLALDSRESVYHYAPGPPCRVAYHDYTLPFRELFGARG